MDEPAAEPPDRQPVQCHQPSATARLQRRTEHSAAHGLLCGRLRLGEVDSLLSLYRKARGKQGSVIVPFDDEFTAIDPACTASPGLDVRIVNGQLQLTNTDAAPIWFGTLSRWVDLNLDQTPYLLISVTSLADAWSLQVDDGSGPITVQGDNNNIGLFTYNLRQVTGWSGVSFQVVIRVAIQNKPATFHFLRIEGVNAVREGAASFDTQ